MEISELYEQEVALLSDLTSLDVGSDEYKELVNDITEINIKISEEREKHMAIYDYNYSKMQELFYLHLLDKFQDKPFLKYIQNWRKDGIIKDAINDTLYDVMHDRFHITEEWLAENKDNHKSKSGELSKAVLIHKWLLYDYLYREEDWKAVMVEEV